MVARQVRWGVLSTAKIATQKIIPGIRKSKWGTVAAIASRSGEAAKAAAEQLGIPRHYASYEALLADPEIDAIYNPLPNDLHVEWSIAALRAGKHVLCEKPVGLSEADARRLAPEIGDRHFMEAFMIRFHPQWLEARSMVRSGAIGALRHMHIYFCYNLMDPANIRNRLENGGGALMDVGCYGVAAGRFVFEADPRRVVALVDRDPEFGTDRLTTVIADFGEGRQLSFAVGTQISGYQHATIAGTAGRIELPVAFNPPPTSAATIVVDDGSILGGGSSKAVSFAPVDQYAEEADTFALAVLGDAPLPYSFDDAVKNMQVLDAIFRSEKSGHWEATGL